MKKFVSLFLVFSLLTLSGNLFAKKRGAELIVQKKDGQQVRGELIAVKENSLLMLVSGADGSVNIQDIRIIRIVKKSKALLWFFGGFAVGTLVGVNTGPQSQGFGEHTRDRHIGGVSLAGSLLGLSIGVVAGIDKTIQIEGRTDSAINIVLEKLRKKALIPDYQ